MASSQDTEITLDTGRMLALFFGLVAICAVCFGLGYSMGRKGAAPDTVQAAAQPVSKGTEKVKPAKGNPEENLTFYQSVKQNSTDTQAAVDPQGAKVSDDSNTAPSSGAASDLTAYPPLAGVINTSGYMVQVAAVSKKEDADALVAALKKKNYSVVEATNEPHDQLYHVQVGPFGDVKQAEAMRTKLVGDGYNPIVKK